MKLIKIESLDDLKARAADESGIEVRLQLNGGVYSAKTITYKEGEAIPWCVNNWIDDSHQDLTDAELWTLSHIGEGIDKGALWMEEDETTKSGKVLTEADVEAIHDRIDSDEFDLR